MEWSREPYAPLYLSWGSCKYLSFGRVACVPGDPGFLRCKLLGLVGFLTIWDFVLLYNKIHRFLKYIEVVSVLTEKPTVI